MVSREERKKLIAELIAKCKELGVRLPADEQQVRVKAAMALESNSLQVNDAAKELEGLYGLNPQARRAREKEEEEESDEDEEEEESEEEKPAPKKSRGRKVVEDSEDEEEVPVKAKKASKAAAKSKAGAKAKKSTGTKRKKKTDDDEDDDDSNKKTTSAKKKNKVEVACEANKELYEAFRELASAEFKNMNRFQGMTYSKVGKLIRERSGPITDPYKDLDGEKGVGKASKEKIKEFLETGKIAKLEEYREQM